MILLILYTLFLNLTAFVMFGLDKRRAKRGRWRIPESRLLFTALIGGAAGALLGMLVFHHKTRKWKFRILLPLFLLVNLAVGAALGSNFILKQQLFRGLSLYQI